MNSKKVDLAVIIPTLNEEHFIGRLLDSIASQTFLPKELVIVDAFSSDLTTNEVRKRQKILPQLKIYQISKYTVAKQRNFGVAKTKAEHILFLDADMVLKDKETLDSYRQEILHKKPDIAIATNLPDSNYWKDRLFFFGMDKLFKASQSIWPMAVAMNMYIKRSIFDKVGGFDPDVKVGEDFELLQRIVRSGGKFIILKKPKIYTSTRRQRKEGRRNMALKSIKSFAIVNLYGYKHNKIPYEFGKFKK